MCSLNSNAVVLKAQLLLYGLFFKDGFFFAGLFSEIVWEMILLWHLDKIERGLSRRQQAKFIDTLQSLPQCAHIDRCVLVSQYLEAQEQQILF